MSILRLLPGASRPPRFRRKTHLTAKAGKTLCGLFARFVTDTADKAKVTCPNCLAKMPK